MGEGGEEELRWWWEGSRERRSYATRGARTTERPVEWILGRRNAMDATPAGAAPQSAREWAAAPVRADLSAEARCDDAFFARSEAYESTRAVNKRNKPK